MPIRLDEITEETKPVRLDKIDKTSKPVRLDSVMGPLSGPVRLSDIPNEEKVDFSKMSWLGKALDIIGRPSQAVKSVIKEDMLNPPKNPLEAISPLYHLTRPNIMEAAKRGFTGKERTTMNELYKKAGVEGVPLLGFASEVAVDPLTYTAGPLVKGIAKVLSPVAKGVKAAGVAAREIPIVDKAVTKVGDVLTPIAQQAKKAFSASTGNPQLDALLNKYSMSREYLKGKAMEYGIKTRNVIQNLSNKTGRSVDDISKEIVNLIELPGEAKSTLPETQALANILSNHFTDTLTKEMKAGVPISAMTEGERGIQYFPRITSKEAKEYLKQAKIGNAKVWNPKIANALQRKTGDFTLNEFNAFVKEHGLESLGGRSVEQFFMQNPAYAVATRGVRSAKAVTSAQFLNEAAQTFGKVGEAAPTFWEEAPEALQKALPALKGKKFDPEVLSEVNKVYTKMLNPTDSKGFLKLFDNVQNYWKAWTLSPFPKYHLRNVAGNLWNNYLAGVFNPKTYGEAAAIQAYRKTGKEYALKPYGITKQGASDIINEAEKLGVLGRGWYGSDIPEAIESATKKPSLNIFSTEGFVTKGGRALGTTLENNARLAHFIDKIKKGASPEDAAISVKKYLFDYNDLSPFEKQVMKRMLPFYTWTRKNIPLQAEQLIKQPQKYIPIAKSLQGRNEQDLKKLSYAQPSLYERLPVEIKRDKNTVSYMPLEGVVPAADLSKMVRPQELFTELLSPYIKTPIELGINKSFYSEREIEKYPKETQEFLRMDIPVKWKYALTSVFPQARLLGSLNTIIKKKEKSEPLTAGEAALEHSLSKVYKQNLDELTLKATQNIMGKMNELKKALRWSALKNRDKESERILDTIHKTIEELNF